jgi:D-alanyl-D-alanine carboxypeptidase
MLVLSALLVLLFSASRTTPARPAQEAPLIKAKIQAAVDRLQRDGTIPGINAAVVLADGTLIRVSAGWRDREGRETLKPGDRMLSGSIGKTYVAALALQLVKEGSLSLDAKVERYLGREPWFMQLPNARDMTVRMLLNHTSGLMKHEAKPEFLKSPTLLTDKTWKPEQLLGFLAGEPPLFPAGQGWHYSDSNYILVGLIIERLTGRPYYDLLKQRLLLPLGLKATIPSDSRRIPGVVQGYAGAGNSFGFPDAMLVDGVFAVNPQAEWTGGGLASTAMDLARWAKLLFEGKAFDASLLPVMLDGVATDMGPGIRYGLGVVLRPTPLGPSYSHGGIFPGYRSVIAYFPDRRSSVALQLNTSDSAAFPKPYFEMAVDVARAALEH